VADGEDLRIFGFSSLEATLVLEHDGKIMAGAQDSGVLIANHGTLKRDDGAVFRLRSSVLAAESQQVGSGVPGVQGIWILITERASTDSENFRELDFSFFEAALVLEHDGKIMASAQHRGMLISHCRALKRRDSAVFRLRSSVLAAKSQHVGGGMPSRQGIRVFLTEVMPAHLQHYLVFGVRFVQSVLGLEEHGEALPDAHRLRVVFTDGPALDLQDRSVLGLGRVILLSRLQDECQILARGQGVWMLIAENP
jgi:hypothetical protein